MTMLRIIMGWISRHHVLTAFIVVTLAAIGLVVRVLTLHSGDLVSEPLRRGPIVQSVYGIGTVTANRSFQIKPGVIATIDELFVKEGDAVKRGERLAVIDNVTYRAPFSGTVTYLPFKVRENVFTQAVVLTLVDLSDRYLVVSLEQQGALRVERGQKVRMSFDTIRSEDYQGVVQAVYSNDSNFLARIDVSSLPPRILPGMTADVAIEIRTHPDALLVPVASLEQPPGGHARSEASGFASRPTPMVVWVRRNHDLARQIPVQVGIVDRDLAEVVSGALATGDRVLIRKRLGP